MRCILAFLALVGSCSALMVGSAPSHAMRVAVSPMMKGRMGSANGGGDPAKSDKKSRGLIRRLITVVRGCRPCVPSVGRCPRAPQRLPQRLPQRASEHSGTHL